MKQEPANLPPLRPSSPDAEREARLQVLDGLLSRQRRENLEEAIANRIDSLTLIADGLYDLGNASAIMRTCEAFGLHRMYIVELTTPYKEAERSSRGAHKWLKIERFGDPIACADAAHAAGYTLVGADVKGTVPLHDIDPNQKLAFVLGSEHDGMSEEMKARCDLLYRIDMRGLVESYNVGVAAALSLYHVLERRRDAAQQKGEPLRGDLSPEQKDALREIFYRKAQKRSDFILRNALGVAPPPLPKLEGPLAAIEEYRHD